jgi:urease accessory protein
MNRILTAGLVPLLSVLSAAAYAHGVHGTTASFSAGFAHPFMGLDHAFAMIAIGVYAAQSRSSASCIAAACALAAGALLAGILPAAPFFEGLVAISVCALGVLLLGRRIVAPAVGVASIALFAFAHGAVHGVEQPVEFSSSEYVAGVLVASVLLQAVGAALVRILERDVRLTAVPLTAAGAWIFIMSLM